MQGNPMFAEWFDAASLKLRETLGVLAGVSEETLRRLDHLSHPRKDTPPPHNEEATFVYQRLVLLALAENAAHLEGQRQSPKVEKTSTRRGGDV